MSVNFLSASTLAIAIQRDTRHIFSKRTAFYFLLFIFTTKSYRYNHVSSNTNWIFINNRVKIITDNFYTKIKGLFLFKFYHFKCSLRVCSQLFFLHIIPARKFGESLIPKGWIYIPMHVCSLVKYSCIRRIYIIISF